MPWCEQSALQAPSRDADCGPGSLRRARVWKRRGWLSQEAGEREPPAEEEGVGPLRAEHMSQAHVS